MQETFKVGDLVTVTCTCKDEWCIPNHGQTFVIEETDNQSPESRCYGLKGVIDIAYQRHELEIENAKI